MTNSKTFNLGGNFEIFNCLRLFVLFSAKKCKMPIINGGPLFESPVFRHDVGIIKSKCLKNRISIAVLLARSSRSVPPSIRPHPFPISLSVKKYALRKQHEELVTKVVFPLRHCVVSDLALEIWNESYLKWMTLFYIRINTASKFFLGIPLQGRYTW